MIARCTPKWAVISGQLGIDNAEAKLAGGRAEFSFGAATGRKSGDGFVANKTMPPQTICDVCVVRECVKRRELKWL